MRQSKFHRDIPNDAKIVMKMPDKSMYVVVLNDGETFTGVEGCKILSIPNDIEGDDVDVYVKEHSCNGTDIVIPDDDSNIEIEVQGGCVVDIKGLPEGYTYTLIDRDSEAVGE